MKDITFSRNVEFLGRNGLFKQSGISVATVIGNRVMLEPITSKGDIGRASLEIPNENVVDVIKALLEHVPATEKIKMIQDPEWVVKT